MPELQKDKVKNFFLTVTRNKLYEYQFPHFQNCLVSGLAMYPLQKTTP